MTEKHFSVSSHGKATQDHIISHLIFIIQESFYHAFLHKFSKIPQKFLDDFDAQISLFSDTLLDSPVLLHKKSNGKISAALSVHLILIWRIILIVRIPFTLIAWCSSFSRPRSSCPCGPTFSA